MTAALCIAPAAVVFVAFWLLPMAELAWLPASKGAATYLAVLTEPRYFKSLMQTTALSAVVTVVSLSVAAAVGLYLGRRQFFGRRFLLSLLTLPLSFPGVIVGFFVILVGGRQGPFASFTETLIGQPITFAYGLAGLFLAYVYFSLPRAIASSHKSSFHRRGAGGEISRASALLVPNGLPRIPPACRLES